MIDFELPLTQCIELLKAGKPKEALRLLMKLHPTPAMLTNVGIAWSLLGNTKKTEAAFVDALAIDEYHLEAGIEYSALLLQTHKLREAGDLLKQLLSRHNDPRLLRTLAFVRLDEAKTEEAVELLRQVLALDPSERSHRELCFYRLHLSGDCYAEHQAWARLYPKGSLREQDRSGRVGYRIGYLCPESSTVYQFFLPVLANHQKDVYCYSDVCDGDISNQLANHGRLVDIRSMNDEQVAAAITRDKINVLVDLRVCRPGVLALKPADKMFSMIGYPHQYGIDGVKLVADHWAYRPNVSGNKIASTRSGITTYGSINRVCKINKYVAASWGHIIRKTNSKLLVLAPGGESNRAVRSLLEVNGVPAAKLELVPTGTHEQYQDLLSRIDVNLDTWPYSGTTTTADAMYTGIPTVTFSGTEYRSQITSYFNEMCSMGSLNASSEEEYAEIAIALATTPWVEADEMRVLMKPLLDGNAVARGLETLYVQV